MPIRLSACLASVCPTLLAASVQARVLVNSGGFESPAFTEGELGGQGDWIWLGDGDSTASIQSLEALTGQQSLRVDRAANSNRFWFEPIDQTPAGRIVSIDWNMRVEQTPFNAGFGSLLGVQAFDDTSGAVLQSIGLGVDASTGDVLFQAAGSGFLTETGTSVAFGEWSRFRIEIGFDSKTYSGFANDDEVVTDIGFVDGATITSLSDVDVVALTSGGDGVSRSNAGTAFLNNCLVRGRLRADYNSDGFVNAADYTVWRETWPRWVSASPATVMPTWLWERATMHCGPACSASAIFQPAATRLPCPRSPSL